MIDPKKLFEDFLGGGAKQPGGKASGLSGNLGTLATGALGGGLIGLLLGSKKVRKFGGTALGIGGAAVLGGLAYKAWQDWSANRARPRPSRRRSSRWPCRRRAARSTWRRRAPRAAATRASPWCGR